MSLSTAFSPKALGCDLKAPALLEEQAFEQIGGTGRAAVGDRQAELGDASLEVVRKARYRARQLCFVVLDQALAKIVGDRPAKRLIGGLNAGLEVRPEIFEHVGRQLPQGQR